MSGTRASIVFYAGLPSDQASVVRTGCMALHTPAVNLREFAAPPDGAMAVVLPAVLVPRILAGWGGPHAAPPVIAVADGEDAGAAALEAGATLALLLPLTEAGVRLRLRELVATSLGQSLGAVLESMTDGFAAADASGAITAVNDAFCELLGYRRDEIIGAVPPYPFWAPEATRELEDALVEVLSGASTHVRLRYRHRDGHRLTLAASVSPLVGPDGAPAGAVGLFRDDTAQEAVERRLRASADELRGLVDHLPGAAVLRLPDGSLRLNARARELIGWPERELATVEDWFRLLYAGRAEDVQARYERARAEGFPSSVIGRLATPTGTRVMEFFAYRAPDHSEVWLATDVTERLEAQEERDRQAARLAAVMEALPDLVIRLRRDGRMMAAHGAPELLAVNDPSADVNIREVLPPEVAQMSLAAIAAALDTGEIQQIQYPLEVGAGRRWFTTRIAPMAGDEVVCVVRDDTERLHAERDRDRVFRITAAPMAVWDLSGRALEINPAMERLLGWSVQELDAMGVDGWVHPEDLPAVNDAISRLARGLASQNLPQRLRRKGGGWVWTEVTASPDRDRGLVYVSVHDITDRRRTELEQQSLARVAEMVAQDVEPDVLFGVVAEEVGRLFESDGAGVARFDGDVMRIAARWGDDPGLTAEAAGESPLEGDRASAEVARTGRPARYDRWLPDQSGRVQRSSVAAPVRVAGRLWGAVGAVNTTRGRFEDGAEDHLARFGELLALAISNAQMRARLIAEATTDPLTGLANHRSFKERLAEEMARAQRHRRPLALAVIDLDHFKRVNDRFGHQVGDAVLVEAARRLRERCRATDLIARVGGEEFAWLMPETDGLDAWQAAERAREALAGTLFATAGRVTASIGVCDLTHAGTADDLYRFADGALYWAKHHGRDVAFMYSPDVVEVLSDAEQAERLLRHQAMQSIRVLARAVDAKDTSTREHSERVADTAVAIATALGWPVERAALLREAGLVHDVGKIAVPDSILSKPGRLTPEEYETIKTHAAAGAEIVADVLMKEQVAWVRGHHERWDGNGYPDGLAGEEIPDGARILALADSWDVMTSARAYQDPLPFDRAVAECERCAGTQFWRPAVEALVRLHEVGALERADTSSAIR